MAEQTGARAKSAGRALAILELISSGRQGLTFGQIAQATRFPKSSLHELLTVLCDRRFLSQDPDSQRYSVGIRLWESGEAYIRNRDLVEEAKPVIQAIVAELNETVQVAVLENTDVLYVARVDSSHPVRLQSATGSRLPAHATGLGKALLSGLSDVELAARFEGRPLAGLTPHTIRNQHDLMDDLGRVRALGFALDDEESMPDLRCVAVPIRGHRGSIVAAMSAAIPITRASPSGLARALTLLGPAALKISAALGCLTPSLTLTAVQDGRVAEDAIVQCIRASRARLEPGFPQGSS